jgi:hypothetical protein
MVHLTSIVQGGLRFAYWLCYCPVSGVVSVWLEVAVAWWCPVCPGAHRLRRRRGRAPFGRWDGLCWSGWCGQGAEPLPAGQERLLPRYLQSGLIFRIRCRAWDARRAGMCQIR